MLRRRYGLPSSTSRSRRPSKDFSSEVTEARVTVEAAWALSAARRMNAVICFLMASSLADALELDEARGVFPIGVDAGVDVHAVLFALLGEPALRFSEGGVHDGFGFRFVFGADARDF